MVFLDDLEFQSSHTMNFYLFRACAVHISVARISRAPFLSNGLRLVLHFNKGRTRQQWQVVSARTHYNRKNLPGLHFFQRKPGALNTSGAEERAQIFERALPDVVHLANDAFGSLSLTMVKCGSKKCNFNVTKCPFESRFWYDCWLRHSRWVSGA